MWHAKIGVCAPGLNRISGRVPARCAPRTGRVRRRRDESRLTAGGKVEASRMARANLRRADPSEHAGTADGEITQHDEAGEDPEAPGGPGTRSP